MENKIISGECKEYNNCNNPPNRLFVQNNETSKTTRETSNTYNGASKNSNIMPNDSNGTSKDFIVHGPAFSCTPDPRGVGPYIFDKLEEHGEKVCQVCSITGRRETFASVKLRSIRLAVHLKKLNIRKQDVVMLCNLNTLDSIIPILATQFLGGITASLDPSLSLRDMTHLVGLAKPKLIFTCPESVDDIKKAVKDAGVEAQIIVFGEGIEEGCVKFSDFSQPTPEEETFTPVFVNNRETAFVLFSSGTTGLPKGLCISSYGIIHACLSLLDMGVAWKSVLLFASFYWISTLNLTILGIITGGQRVVCPKFDPDNCFKIIQDYKVTYAFFASPYMYKMDESNISPYDTSSFTMCHFGGGAVSGNQLKKVRKLLSHTKVMLVYGMTEISGFISGYHHQDRDFAVMEQRIKSSGLTAPGLAMKIVDPETEGQLGPNGIGEVRILAKSFFTDYFHRTLDGGLKDGQNVQNSGGNKEDAFDKEGWLKTGDVGYFDEDNFLYVVDRIKEMFKYQSWHIVPASLEAIVLEHPSVQDTIVIGIPHEIDGDHPAALVVLKKGHSVTPDEIQRFVDERVIDRQRLRGGVRVVKELLKTPTGKVLRRVIRAKVLNGEL